MARIFSPKKYSRLVEYVLKNGKEADSARGKTKEIVNADLLLRNPLDRLVTESWRKVNLPFGVAEWLGMIYGIDDLSFFQQFISTYDQFSSDGVHVDGAYGPRLHDTGQIERVIHLLQENPLSRRAVVTIYNLHDLWGAGGLNTPCTLTIQFLVRNEKLVTIVNMRSNDIIKGLTYDVFVFTMLQEYIASVLGLKLGEYYHHDGSLHIYEPDWKILESRPYETRWTPVMASMPYPSHDQLDALLKCYMSVKLPRFDVNAELLLPYFKDLAYAARVFVYRHEKETVRKYYFKIVDYTIRRVLRPWIMDKI